jgi:hypothetical protein
MKQDLILRKAHDVRHLRVCKVCGDLGDGRRMLKLPDGHYHDECIVARLTDAQVMRLPREQTQKITLGAAMKLGRMDMLRALIECGGA